MSISRAALQRLPKVALTVPVTPAGSVSHSVLLVLDRLAHDGVVYAELLLDLAAFPFSPAQEALQQAADVIRAHNLDARIIVAGEVLDSADPLMVGVGVDGTDTEAIRTLAKDFVPVTVSGDVAALTVGIQAGAVRTRVGVDIVDDFSASVDGIVPGRFTAWLRDRHIPLEMTLDNVTPLELADHPLPLLQELGFTCTLSPTAETTLTEAFLALADTFSYGVEEFFELTSAAVRSSFSTEEHRRHLLETVILPAYETD